MKKIRILILLIIIFPLNVFAYSEKIIPGGENIGISINTNGLVVVGFYKVNGEFIGKSTLKTGDTILEIEGVIPESINDMTTLIDEKITNNMIGIKIKRGKKILNTTLKLVNDNGVYKTGLYIKEKVTGIGTLTYIDPITKIYGSLGHEIIMADTNQRVEVKNGAIFESFVNGINRSTGGVVGSKNASIQYNKEIGSVVKNTNFGLFGKYTNNLPQKDLMQVANFNEIKLGEAYIYTIVEGNVIKTYEINIKDISESKIKTSKSIRFEITDEELMNDTGGVVQGMSGSPIIQDNRIIGAVTHVVVTEPENGYGIFIRTMLEEGEK